MIDRITRSPMLVRVVPFVVFVVLTALQGEFGGTAPYWLYLGKTIAAGTLLWSFRRSIAEMKWRFSWEAVVVGVGVFIVWIALGGRHRSIEELFHMLASSTDSNTPREHSVWNPFIGFAGNAALAWGFILVRMIGSSLIVPPMEEVFFRSFLYRWVANPEFEREPLGRFAWKPFLIVGLLFGVEHEEWVAGILCGFAYQGLVIRKKRLGDAITAHAITNALLGIWVVTRDAWAFW